LLDACLDVDVELVVEVVDEVVAGLYFAVRSPAWDFASGRMLVAAVCFTAVVVRWAEVELGVTL
jgi:hypothetical protein